MRHRRRTTICREGWYYVLLTTAVLGWASLREANLLVIIAGLLCGPLVLSWLLGAGALRRIEVRRHVAATVHAGTWLTVDIQIRNAARRLGIWAVAVQDAIQPHVTGQRTEGVKPEVLFPYLRAGASSRQTYRVCLPQRGQYRLGPVVVSTRFPFGLFRHRMVWDALDLDGSDKSSSGELVVLPRLGQLRREARPAHTEVLEGSLAAKRPARASGDFFALRDWQTGDSPRWVHWRSTARQRQLMVRQFEQPAERDLALLVDLWLPPRPNAEQIENVELAVSYAATLVHDLCRTRTARLWLAIAAAEPVCLGGLVSPPLRREALEKLAVAQASDEDRLPALFEAVQGRLNSVAQVLLVSTRANDLEDTRRFAVLDPVRGQRCDLRRIRSLHPAQPEFGEQFVVGSST